MRFIRVLSISVLCLSACGEDSATPEESGGGRVGLAIVAGAGVTDTITAQPTQALVVQLVDEKAHPQVGIDVRFEVPSGGNMSVSSVAGDAFGTVTSSVTDAKGRAGARVRLGGVAAAGKVVVSVPLFSLVDTARYTVQVGAPVRLSLAPRDTALSLGASLSLRVAVTDRLGNPRTDPLSFTGDAVVQSTGSGQGKAIAVGVGYLKVRGSGSLSHLADSTRVGVVPAAQAVWSGSNPQSLTLGDLSGGNLRILTTQSALAASWKPGGDHVAVTMSGLYLVDVNGTVTQVPTPNIRNGTWPEYSSDGSWLYFHGEGSSGMRVFRVHTDGSGLETVTSWSAYQPTPSPDGKDVAYVTSEYGGPIEVLTFATRARRVLTGTSGVGPRWSPDGQWIAYVNPGDGGLYVVRPDGTGLRNVVRSGVSVGVTWSPDARWVLASNGNGMLVDVATGATIRLPWRGTYPAWRR